MSRLTYDALSVDGLKEVLQQISSACKKLEIDFFIVGAVARNIWLASNSEPTSGTKDIDFGVYIPTIDKYNELRRLLITEHNYFESEENAFCLLNPSQKQIDLLPFGKIEIEDKVLIEGKGLREINLHGFKESFQLGKQKVKIGDEEYEACSIPGIMILKLIAFDDRPEMRIKDIKDVNAICNYYPQIETENIWNNHSDLYEEGREHQEVGVIVLGREMNKILIINESLRKRVISILEKGIKQESDLLKHMIENSKNETIEMKERTINNLIGGIISA